MNPLARTAKLLAIALTAATGALTPALATPAAASASSRTPAIVLGGFSDRGYQVAVLVSPFQTQAGIVITLQRREGRQYQYYQFIDTDDATFKASRGTTTVTVKANLGTGGLIDLKLRFAIKSGRLVMPNSYSLFDSPAEQMTARTGIATGLLKFNSHTLFGTIRRTRLRAFLVYLPTLSSSGDDPALAGLVTYGSPDLPYSVLLAARRRSMADVTARYFQGVKRGFPFEFQGFIEESGPMSIFTHVGLASSRAAVNGAFMAGSLSYRSTITCSKDLTYGSLTGSLVAHFLIGGRQVYPGSHPADGVWSPPAGVPNPFGSMFDNGPDRNDVCGQSDGDMLSSAPPLTLP